MCTDMCVEDAFPGPDSESEELSAMLGRFLVLHLVVLHLVVLALHLVVRSVRFLHMPYTCPRGANPHRRRRHE